MALTKMEFQARLQAVVTQNIELRRHNLAVREAAQAMVALLKSPPAVADFDRWTAILYSSVECLRDLADTANQTGEQINTMKEGGIAIGLARASWLVRHGNLDKFDVMVILDLLVQRRIQAGEEPIAIGLDITPTMDNLTRKMLTGDDK